MFLDSSIAVGTASRLSIGLVLLLASVSKLFTFGWFSKVITDLGLALPKFAYASAAMIVLGEFQSAVLLLLDLKLRWAAGSALGLLIVFGAGIALAMARGNAGKECGCLGPWAKGKLGWRLVVRNLGLAGLAFLSGWSTLVGHGLLAWGLFLLCLVLTFAFQFA
jgi:Methylamine utilisation protein MauE